MELFNEIQSGCEAGVYQPLLAFMKAKKLGEVHPPYVPKWDVLPIPVLCKLALIWDEIGFSEEAAKLAYLIQKLEPFSSFWCPEKQFNEYAHRKLVSQVKNSITPIECPLSDYDVDLLENDLFKAAFSLTGNNTSLGSIKVGEMEIRAFGPQNTSYAFGIQGKGEDGWTHTAFSKETWLNMQTALNSDALELFFRFVGLRPEEPTALAFYVRAANAEVNGETMNPGSLKRFNGEGSSISFEGKLTIESSLKSRIQVIPLAGEGCFWDCQFLVLFEMNPLTPQISYKIKAPLSH